MTGLIVDPLARRLTHIVVRDDTVPAADHLVSLAQEVQEALGHKDIAMTRVYLERVRTERDTHSRQIARRLGIE